MDDAMFVCIAHLNIRSNEYADVGLMYERYYGGEIRYRASS